MLVLGPSGWNFCLMLDVKVFRGVLVGFSGFMFEIQEFQRDLEGLSWGEQDLCCGLGNVEEIRRDLEGLSWVLQDLCLR